MITRELHQVRDQRLRAMGLSQRCVLLLEILRLSKREGKGLIRFSLRLRVDSERIRIPHRMHINRVREAVVVLHVVRSILTCRNCLLIARFRPVLASDTKREERGPVERAWIPNEVLFCTASNDSVFLTALVKSLAQFVLHFASFRFDVGLFLELVQFELSVDVCDKEQISRTCQQRCHGGIKVIRNRTAHLLKPQFIDCVRLVERLQYGTRPINLETRRCEPCHGRVHYSMPSK